MIQDSYTDTLREATANILAYKNKTNLTDADIALLTDIYIQLLEGGSNMVVSTMSEKNVNKTKVI
jgi:hypothetical protein